MNQSLRKWKAQKSLRESKGKQLLKKQAAAVLCLYRGIVVIHLQKHYTTKHLQKQEVRLWEQEVSRQEVVLTCKVTKLTLTKCFMKRVSSVRGMAGSGTSLTTAVKESKNH